MYLSDLHLCYVAITREVLVVTIDPKSPGKPYLRDVAVYVGGCAQVVLSPTVPPVPVPPSAPVDVSAVALTSSVIAVIGAEFGVVGTPHPCTLYIGKVSFVFSIQM